MTRCRGAIAAGVLVLSAIIIISCSGGSGGGSGPAFDNNALLASLTLSIGTLSPVFSSATATYTTDVSVSTSAAGVTASTAGAKATMTINGTSVVSGATHTVALPVGQTAIEIVVTAEDGASSETYTITATRPGVGLSPASVNVVAGHGGVMTAVLAAAAAGDTVVTLSSSNSATVTVPASVIISASASQADFTVTSIAAGPAAVTISATLGSDTATATVNVLSATCGNGILDLNEACDDSNTAANDGCSTVCAIETGWTCGGEPSVCAPVCGDDLVKGTEQCDTGVNNGSTMCGCQANCSYAAASVSCTTATACTNEMFCDGVGSCTPVTNKTDGTACGSGQVCSSGACVTATLPQGSACTAGAECQSGFCADGYCCNAACNDACNACSVTKGASSNGTCGLATSAVVCRPSAGSCDMAETCNGASAACPADNLAPNTTVCRAAAGSCDIAETCTGGSASCPSDGFQPSSYVCQAQSCTGSTLTPERNCNGANALCPASAPISCDDGNQCHANVCSGTACDHADVVDGTTCTLTNVSSAVCATGQCTASGSCTAGYGDCNGTMYDGCETNTQTDMNNCGGCGTICATTCTSGVCENCDDGIACTIDSYDTGSHTCVHTLNNAVCDDGNWCNGVEICDATADCVAGTPLDCNDYSECTADACDALLGCSHTPVINGLSCMGTGSCQDGTCIL